MHYPWLRGAGDILGELLTSIILKMNIEDHFDREKKVDFMVGIKLVPIGPETTVKGQGRL